MLYKSVLDWVFISIQYYFSGLYSMQLLFWPFIGLLYLHSTVTEEEVSHSLISYECVISSSLIIAFPFLIKAKNLPLM